VLFASRREDVVEGQAGSHPMRSTRHSRRRNVPFSSRCSPAMAVIYPVRRDSLNRYWVHAGVTLSIPARPSTFWGPVLGTPASTGIREDHDVLVIGAGITGLTTALLLARQGVDVAVVDARRPGSGTTAKSTAKASLLQSVLGSQTLRKHGPEALRHYAAANLAGQQIIRSVVEETKLVDMQVRDAWTYATTTKGAKQVRAEYDALNEAGLPVELTIPSELPYSVTEAVRLPDQLQINPSQYLAALHAQLTALDVPVVWPQRIARVDSKDGVLRVTSTRGLTTKAKWVVLATLLPFPLRTMAFATTTPMRSYAMAARVSSPIPQGMYISVDSPNHSLRTGRSAAGEEYLLVGGYGHQVGHKNPTSTHVAELAQWTQDTFDVREFTHRWSAQDYTSSHLLPQVGPSPLGPSGVLIATGFGKWGITNGSAAAQMLTGHITGDEPSWAALFAPRVAGLPKIAKQNAEVAFTLAKGWLVEPHSSKDVKVGLPAPRAVSNVGGKRRECSAVCTHLGGIVRFNDAEDSWDCPLHGSRFDADGSVLEGPAVEALDGHHDETLSSQSGLA